MKKFNDKSNLPGEFKLLAQIDREVFRLWINIFDKLLAMGKIDRRTKILACITAAAVTRCKACVATAVRLAKEMGVSDDEIKEMIALSVFFTGNPGLIVGYDAIREG